MKLVRPQLASGLVGIGVESHTSEGLQDLNIFYLEILQMEINLENYTIHDNTIVIFDNVVSEEVCKNIINEATEKGSFQPSQTFSRDLHPDNDDPGHRESEGIPISLVPSLKQLDQTIFKIFDTGVIKYRKMMIESGLGTDETIYGSDILIKDDEGYDLLRYKEGGYYIPHYDQACHMNKTGPVRIISALFYLDGECEGGETEFIYQKIKVKPQAGRLLFFPSTYTHPHQCCPITKGVKHVIVTWFR